MTVREMILVFAGIPVAVFVVVAGLVYGTSARSGRRYRPGRRFTFRPVWYVASNRTDAVAAPADRPALEAAPEGAPERPGWPRPTGVVGGAHGSW